MAYETISVFGLGYVGTVTAACLASRGHRIIGVDVQQGKVEALAEGRSPIVEPEVDTLLSDALSRDLVSATSSVSEAVGQANVFVICVGTPSNRKGELDLSFVESVFGQLADCLSSSAEKKLVVLRSTSLPGSTRKLWEKYFSKMGDKVEVWFVPEFLREGTAVADFNSPSLSVIGVGGEGRAGAWENVAKMFDADGAKFVRWEEAESLKYACNAFHATKVAFANEIGRFAKSLEIDSRSIMKLLCDDTELNISPYYMKPGNPYGGSCLPKDVSALCGLASRQGVSLPLIQALADSNRIHQEFLLSQVLEFEEQRIGFLGLSFKDATDDLRNSCNVSLAESLIGRGFDVTIFDPKLNASALVGSNRSSVMGKLPHLDRLLCHSLEEFLGKVDLVVVSQKCATIDELERHCSVEHTLFDVNGWPELNALGCKYRGFCW